IFNDPWGSWGKPEADPGPHATLDHTLAVSDVRVLETGPWRASLFVRLSGPRSRIDLTFRLYAEQDFVEVHARVFFDENVGRMKLLFPAGDRAEFEVPGASIEREPNGEMPGGRWVRIKRDGGADV